MNKAFFTRLKKQEEKAHANGGDIFENLEKIIGDTPKIKTTLDGGGILLQSDESENPTENHYDRVFMRIFKKLMQNGKIRSGETIYEITSGTSGISFAWMARKLGFKPVVFVPSFTPKPKLALLEYFSHKVYVNTDKKRYLLPCLETMHDVAKKEKEGYILNHREDPETRIGFSRIADELMREYPRTKLDFFIGGVGNGSTLLGIGEKLKSIYPDIKIIGFEPKAGCPYYKRYRAKWGKKVRPMMKDAEIPRHFGEHMLTGAGGFGNISFPFMEEAVERGIIDDIVVLDDKKILPLAKAKYNRGLEPARQLGNSSIVARYIAEKVSLDFPGKNFVSLIYDKAERY